MIRKKEVAKFGTRNDLWRTTKDKSYVRQKIGVNGIL